MRKYTKYFVVEDDKLGQPIFYPKSQFYSEVLDRFMHKKLDSVLNIMDIENLSKNQLHDFLGLLEREGVERPLKQHAALLKSMLKKEQAVLKRIRKVG